MILKYIIFLIGASIDPISFLVALIFTLLAYLLRSYFKKKINTYILLFFPLVLTIIVRGLITIFLLTAMRQPITGETIYLGIGVPIIHVLISYFIIKLIFEKIIKKR